MPVPNNLNDLSATASSNSPAGSDSIGTSLDEYLRSIQAIIKRVTTGADAMSSPALGTPLSGVLTNCTGTAAGLTAGTATTATTANAGPGNTQFGLRNKIINGKMEIAQRGTSFPAIANAGISLDRWQFGTTSAAVITASQQSDAPAGNEFQSSLRLAVTTADASIAAGDVTHISQKIEGYNVRDLIGRDFTLSFRVRSSKTGVHCVAFRNSTPDRSYVMEYTVNAANTWETKSVTVPGGLITAGTWDWTNGIGLRADWILAAGTTFQTTANAWQTGNFYATANQVNCLDTIGNIFAITGVQLEAGSVATPFEHRPYGVELALCQRYYVQANEALSAGAYAQSSTTHFVQYFLPQPMRTSPAISASWGSGSNANAGTFNAISNRVCQSSITPVSVPGNFSAVATWGSFSSEL